MNNEPIIDQRLLELWQHQDEQISAPAPSTIQQTLQTSYREEERRLIRLTVQEVLPSFLVAGMFAWFGVRSDQHQWAYYVAAGLSLAVGGFLLSFLITQRVSAFGFGDSLRSQLERSVTQHKNRAWLYRNVFWWYLAPIGTAVGLIVYAQETSAVAGGVFGLFYAAFLTALYVVNRRIGRRYEDTFDRLAELRRNLDGDGPSGIESVL